MKTCLLHRACAIFAGLLGAATASAATFEVSSIGELQSRIAAAVAGDRIVVLDGTYTTTAAIPVNRAGAEGSPITIAAETVGGVEIAGTHGFTFSSPAAYIVIDGFKFTHRNSINISSSAHHIRLTRNIIELTIPAGSDTSYINISGHDVEIDRNELRNKSTLGNMLDVTGSGSQVARRLWVHHNYFHDFTSPGGNGAETIRLGLSGLSLSTGDALVEYNLFVRCNGENEMISNKSSGNTYRYNTILDSPGAELTLRHGDDCIVYGNYIKNSSGLRVYGDRHQIFSNYFEGNSKGVDMGNGDGDVHAGDPLTAHDRPDDCVVSFNTFINNNVHYQMGGRTNGLGALNITVANNIMQGPGNAANVSSSAPYTGVWEGNLLWNVNSPGAMPAGSYTIENPLLAPNAQGILHLQAGSPAIDSGVGSYPAVLFDLDGQPRIGAKDKGADEFSNAPVVARPLTPSDVGPFIGMPPPVVVPNITYEAETIAFVPTGGTASIAFEDTASGGTFASPNISDPNDPLYPERRRYVTLNGDGAPPPPDGEYIDFTLPNVPAGTYNFVLRYKTHPNNRAVMRLFIDGVPLGANLDQRAGATFTQRDFGVVRFGAAGDHVVRLAVVGKTNATTTPWNITADVFILVPDATPPFILVPDDIVAEATGPSGAVVTFPTAALDHKDGDVPVVALPPSGSVFPLGTTDVILRAVDFAGNETMETFEVAVVDTTAPVIALPADVIVEATGPAGAIASFAATAEDIVDGAVSVSFSHASGGVFAPGITTVTATATDAAGNAASETFRVIVTAQNITDQLRINASGIRFNRATGRYVQTLVVINQSGAAVGGPVSIAFDGLPSGVSVYGATGATQYAAPTGSQYLHLAIGDDGVLGSHETIVTFLEFTNPANERITYTPRALAGSGIR